MKNRLIVWGAACAFVWASGARAAESFPQGKKSFEAAMAILKSKYVAEGVSEDDFYRAATEGLVQNIDPKLKPWHELLSPADLAALKGELSGKVTGIGVVLKFAEESGVADVLQVLPGTPAAKAGIKRGDRLLRVNGKTYKGKTLKDMVADVRGKVGEKTKLTVLRDAEVVEKTIKRDEIKWENVEGTVLPGNVGLVTVRSFNDSTPKLLESVLKKMVDSKVTALVMDLRGNAGGSLERAEQSIEMLIPKGGVIVQINQRGGKKELVKGTRDPYLPGIPMAVLIDKETASGAEIMTSALNRERKAVLIGAPTRGKWTVQMIDELPNGYAVRFTTGVFGTPGGTIATDAPGITPEIPVNLPEGEDAGVMQRLEKVEERLAQDAPLRSALEIVRKR